MLPRQYLVITWVVGTLVGTLEKMTMALSVNISFSTSPNTRLTRLLFCAQRTVRQ